MLMDWGGVGGVGSRGSVVSKLLVEGRGG